MWLASCVTEELIVWRNRFFPRRGAVLLLQAGLVTTAGCALLVSCSERQTDRPRTDSEGAQKVSIELADPCKLLSGEKVEVALGEAPRDLKPSRRDHGGFVASSCYVELSSPPKSAHVTLLQRASAETPGVATRWAAMFPSDELVDRERAEGGVKLAPIKVEGLGEQALWSVDDRLNALHVREQDCILTVSVGSEGTREERLERARKLAALLLQELNKRK